VSRDDTVVSSHEVRLSTDGGGTYSTILAPSLSGEIFSYSWNVPATLAAARARVRVIARDAVGNQSQADSRDFTIRALDVPQPRLVSYRYDKLNRLVGIIYEDGTRVSFSYDAAGNRTRVVVSGPGAEPARPLPPRSRQGEGTP
jgi:YD repeat-containing protein